jgi:hypothetical protein
MDTHPPTRSTVRPVALPRLRQVAFAAVDLDPVVAQLRSALGSGEPYRDEGVAYFGLRNAVLAVGDSFVEVVSPIREGTAAGRYLERQGGDCGYMAMVEVSDAGAARERVGQLGIRIVWDFAEDDIVDLHLHPRDVPGTLLALDAARPPGSWRWGGPAWTAAVPSHPPGGLRELTIAVADPVAAAQRWAAVLDVPADGAAVPLAGQQVRFTPAGEREGIVALTVAVPEPAVATVVVAAVRIDLLAA